MLTDSQLDFINPVGYNDGRIDDCMKHLPKIKTAVDLGTMEGDNAFLLSRQGITVTGIEANEKHYAKCLAKLLISGNFVKFIHIDVLDYFKTEHEYDLCVCFGILYHMTDPIDLLQKVSNIKNLIIWTHYFNEEDKEANKIVSANNTELHEYKEHFYTYYKQVYDKRSETYCGGVEPTSSWMNKKGILKVLSILGYETKIISDTNTVNGSAILLVCTKN